MTLRQRSAHAENTANAANDNGHNNNGSSNNGANGVSTNGDENKSSKGSSSSSGPSPWNIGAHFRALVTPPSRTGGTAALDGFRAALTTWMILFHSIAYIAMRFADDEIAKVTTRGILSPLMMGPLAVDGFLALTGFLLAYPIFINASSLKNFTITDWWYRRVSRMAPMYFVVLFAYCAFVAGDGIFPMSQLKSDFNLMLPKVSPELQKADNFPGSCEAKLLNVLMINNFFPGGGCMGHTWSLAIQFQWYLLFPIMIKYLIIRNGGQVRHFIIACIIMIIVSIASRPFAFYDIASHNNPLDAFFHSFFWYSSTAGRFHAFPMGAIAAYLCSRDTFITWLRGARLIRYTLLVTSIVFAFSMALWPVWYSDGNMFETPAFVAARHAPEGVHHLIHYIFGNVGSPVSSLLFCFLFVSLVHRVGTFGSVMSKIFSSTLWYPMAQLSFCVYLLHPLLMTSYYNYATLPDTTVTAFMTNAIICFCFVVPSSLLLYITVERPLDCWLRQGDHPRLTKLTFYYCCVLIIVSLAVTPAGTYLWAQLPSTDVNLQASVEYLRKFPLMRMPSTPKELFA